MHECVCDLPMVVAVNGLKKIVFSPVGRRLVLLVFAVVAQFLLLIGGAYSANSQSLGAKEIKYQVACPLPTKARCSIKKPVVGGYSILNENLDVDDFNDFWIVDFKKVKEIGRVFEIMVLSASGELHVIKVLFPVVQDNNDAASKKTTLNEKSPDEKSRRLDPNLKNGQAEQSATPVKQDKRDINSQGLESDEKNKDIKRPISSQEVGGNLTLLPCIHEACIGDDIDSIKTKLEPVKRISEILLGDVDLKSSQKKEGSLDFSKLALEAVNEYENGNMSAFLASVENIAKGLNPDAKNTMIANAKMMAFSYGVAKSSAPNAKSQAIADLARYLVPIKNNNPSI